MTCKRKKLTAINLTVFNLPRLSVDIDLDFIPNLTREETAKEREQLTELLKEYMSEQGYSLPDASRFSHSLDAFHYNYMNAAGNKDMFRNGSFPMKMSSVMQMCILQPVLEHSILNVDIRWLQYQQSWD